MNEPSEPVSASEWLVALLDSPADLSLRARFDSWLVQDPENARAWKETLHTYGLIGRLREENLTDAVPLTAPPRTDYGREARPRRTGRRERRVGLAAASAIAACLVWLLVAYGPGGPVTDFTTQTAEIGSFVLPDGSTLKLAPESAVALLPEADGRGIRLLEGTAFLDVEPDQARPFRVVTEDLSVTVLGTRFEVRSVDGLAEVAVREGAVRVSGSRGEAIFKETLRAGEWLRLATATPVVRGAIASNQVADWLDGRIIARDRPVDEVVDELRTYYPGVVVLRGDRLADQPLTGVFSLSDPQAALRAIAAAQGAEAYSLTPWVTVLVGE